MNYISTLIILVAVGGIVFGQSEVDKRVGDSRDERAILRVLEECSVALEQSDVDALKHIYADDWTFVNTFGAIITKDDRLADLRSGDLKYVYFRIDELSIRVYKKTAIVIGRATIKGQNKWRDNSGQYRVTAVFLKKNGRWQVAAQQSNSADVRVQRSSISFS